MWIIFAIIVLIIIGEAVLTIYFTTRSTEQEEEKDEEPKDIDYVLKDTQIEELENRIDLQNRLKALATMVIIILIPATLAVIGIMLWIVAKLLVPLMFTAL